MGARDAHVAVDLVFHGADKALIERLGVSDRAQTGWNLVKEASFKSHLNRQRRKFVDWVLSNGKSKPQWDRVKFETSAGIGPVDVLEYLSEPGRVAYTHSVLNEKCTRQQMENRTRINKSEFILRHTRSRPTHHPHAIGTRPHPNIGGNRPIRRRSRRKSQEPRSPAAPARPSKMSN